MEDFNKLKWSTDQSADDFISKLSLMKSQMSTNSVQIDNNLFIQKLIDQLLTSLGLLKTNYRCDLVKSETLAYDKVSHFKCANLS